MGALVHLLSHPTQLFLECDADAQFVGRDDGDFNMLKDMQNFVKKLDDDWDFDEPKIDIPLQMQENVRNVMEKIVEIRSRLQLCLAGKRINVFLGGIQRVTNAFTCLGLSTS